MKKLELNVESLEVESFNTAESDGERGTVHARSDSAADVCYSFGDFCTAAFQCTTSCAPSGSRVWEQCLSGQMCPPDDWWPVDP